MQRPTCTQLRVRSPSDAHVIFHAVSLQMLPIVSRRLDTEERRAISSGCVYVWEERGPNAEATGLGIERWTDSIRWGPSRVRDEFLFYLEKEAEHADVEMGSDSDANSPSRFSPSYKFHRENLIKQTYSVFVETPRGRRKWHLIAYFTHDSLDYLHTVDDIPQLASLHVPPGKYKSARSSKGRPSRDAQTFDQYPYAAGVHDISSCHPRYAPFAPDYSVAVDKYVPKTLPPIRAPNMPHVEEVHQVHRSFAHSPRSPLQHPRSARKWDCLAPLAYLQTIPPMRRHPLDEKALMSFTPGLA
ncbi:hypothetical protein HGRIS_002944 [Hohenbuehelia grisea]|uniref:cAMP-independent regulatory protein pac2 n=1 Tax=Hohenbuehelia grisea TaxID=104357 RepID=A0ABR3JN82_9AGAR